MASRILVVDDESVVTEVVERYLRQQDFEVPWPLTAIRH
jgi:DNA-binding response OmpR family regulator